MRASGAVNNLCTNGAMESYKINFSATEVSLVFVMETMSKRLCIKLKVSLSSPGREQRPNYIYIYMECYLLRREYNAFNPRHLLVCSDDELRLKYIINA